MRKGHCSARSEWPVRYHEIERLSLDILFPLAEYWWLYLAFTGLVAILLAVDLLLHRQDRPITFRNAATWTAVWISLALGFSYLLYLFTAARHSPALGRQLSLEFLAGYVVEE